MYVITSPLLYIISMLTGYILAKYKSDQQVEHLYRCNDELQEEVNILNELLAEKQREKSDVD